jgi:hypothetical protein
MLYSGRDGVGISEHAARAPARRRTDRGNGDRVGAAIRSTRSPALRTLQLGENDIATIEGRA